MGGGKLWNENLKTLEVKEDPNVTAIYVFLFMGFFLECFLSAGS